MRLQKYISRAGYCSRRHAETLIVEGKVAVNGKVVTLLGTKVDTDRDRVVVEGKKLSLQENPLYIALNKPAGYVTSCDHPGEKIVMDLLESVKQRVYPVGRLDKDSTGLLLLTNDGKLHLRLTHPSFDHEKEYLVVVAEAHSGRGLESLRKGPENPGKQNPPGPTAPSRESPT